MDWQAEEVQVGVVRPADELPMLPTELRSGEVRFVSGDQGVGEPGVGVDVGDGKVSWLALPIRPTRGKVVDSDRNGCPDLLLGDDTGATVVVYGRCPVPDRIEVTRGTVLDVQSGDALLTRVADPHGLAWIWSSRGGPPGLFVHPDGTIDFDLGPEDVGRYQVRLQRRLSSLPLPGPPPLLLELRVHPDDDRELDVAALPLQVDHHRRVIDAPSRCELGLAATSAVAYTAGSTWRHLGFPSVHGGVSPAFLGACSVGTEVQPLVALEVFPWLDLAPKQPVAAIQLGAQWQWGRSQLGGYGEVATQQTRTELPFGLAPGLGARYHRVAVGPTGPDVRLTWLAPTGVRATVGWSWSTTAK